MRRATCGTLGRQETSVSMGRRGPRPTPTAVLAARGSWRAKVRQRKPQPKSRLGSAPSRLDAAAKAVWRAAVKELAAMQVGASPDRATLERYCTATVRYRRAVQLLLDEGETCKNGKTGMVHVRPEVAIVTQLSTMLLKIEQEFGFTPSARSRIDAEVSAESVAEEKTKARFFAAS